MRLYTVLPPCEHCGSPGHESEIYSGSTPILFGALGPKSFTLRDLDGWRLEEAIQVIKASLTFFGQGGWQKDALERILVDISGGPRPLDWRLKVGN